MDLNKDDFYIIIWFSGMATFVVIMLWVFIIISLKLIGIM